MHEEVSKLKELASRYGAVHAACRKNGIPSFIFSFADFMQQLKTYHGMNCAPLAMKAIEFEAASNDMSMPINDWVRLLRDAAIQLEQTLAVQVRMDTMKVFVEVTGALTEEIRIFTEISDKTNSADLPYLAMTKDVMHRRMWRNPVLKQKLELIDHYVGNRGGGESLEVGYSTVWWANRLQFVIQRLTEALEAGTF